MEDSTESRNMFHSIKALLIDLNGTLHVGQEPTLKAVETVRRLRQAKVPFLFCSNNTKEATTNLQMKLQNMGFELERSELMTSLGSCREEVKRRGLKPFLIMSASAKDEFADLDVPTNPVHCDTVVLGLDPASLHYDNLNIAFRVLRSEPLSEGEPGPSTRRNLLAPHASLFHQVPPDGQLPAGLNIGIGPFVKGLELASGIEAHLVGKPTKSFFESAIARLKANHPDLKALHDSEVAVIGDDIDHDLGEGAQELGLKRILVRTGKYREGMADVDPKPDAIFADFTTCVDALLGR